MEFAKSRHDVVVAKGGKRLVHVIDNYPWRGPIGLCPSFLANPSEQMPTCCVGLHGLCPDMFGKEIYPLII